MVTLLREKFWQCEILFVFDSESLSKCTDIKAGSMHGQLVKSGQRGCFHFAASKTVVYLSYIQYVPSL